ncbi:MAG: polysaccharide pyruvyl transferase family protein [candidate division SR1 bacterium]|nr:polysaccharide pyruvyl transferase family protein [candidate division SR1 bacterium]
MKIHSRLAISEKHILIVGNRSYKNLGDELILLGTVKLLVAEDKKITIAAYDPEWLKKFFSQFIDVSKITFVTEIPKGFRTRIKYIRQGKMKEWKLYKKVDAVIIGGGEIITEENKNSYRYRLVSLLPCLKKPRYLMGGIQLPKKLFNRFLFTRILKRTKHIFARDHETVHEMKIYGFDDVEFFMDTSYFAYDWEKKYNETERKYIVINLNKNAEKFLPEIIQDVKKLYNQGYEIMYIPVAKGKNDYYNDMKYAHKIQRETEIKDQRFTIVDREEDFDGFVKTIAQAHIVISSRLHLFLIASFLGVETKVYPYQKKILKMQKTLEALGI